MSGDWTHKYHKTALLFITRFLYQTFLYLLYLLSLIGIFFRCLFVLTYFDSSRWHSCDNTRDRDANNSCQNGITWCDFLQGKQVKLSPSHSLLQQKTKNLPLALCAHKKIWAQLVGKSIWCTVVLGTSTGCQLKVFLPSKRRDLFYNLLNEVSTLARLASYENFDRARNKCPLSTLTGVRIKQVECRENVSAFPRDKENCL